MKLVQTHRAVIVMALVFFIHGCSNRLVPPDVEGDAVTVYLVDHGRHPTLVLPRADTERWIRYTYGEWRWYAEGDAGLLRGMGALLWPTRGALGRGELRSPPRAAGVSADMPEGWAEVYEFEVAKDRAGALKDDLDDYFKEQTRLHNPRFNLDFSPHPESYWMFNNSNQKMVAWLRDLDVQVSGLGLFSNWQLTDGD